MTLVPPAPQLPPCEARSSSSPLSTVKHVVFSFQGWVPLHRPQSAPRSTGRPLDVARGLHDVVQVMGKAQSFLTTS